MLKELRQAKKLYCYHCDALYEPVSFLTCPSCGTPLVTCWWGLIYGMNKDEIHKLCPDCKNRFWCWTQRPELPTMSGTYM